jgi:C-terminal processing protease CtpA/Prc
LRSFIQEGDVLESVDDQSTAGLTSTQASSVMSSRASNTTRALVFVRNVDESSNTTVKQAFEGVKVIVYAPPGDLGLTVESDTKNGQLIVHSVKPFSPLHGKIREEDVLEYVDGESISDLTATQALSLISSRASNPLRSLAFKRNTEV